jgi:hypothetical protein
VRRNPLWLGCHFGEWVQGRLGPDGPVALITLVPDQPRVAGWWQQSAGLACHAVGHGALARATLARLNRALGGGLQGRVRLRLPYPPGMGTGMSTAGLMAVARMAGGVLSADSLARGCVKAEGASDPLMFAQPSRLLWAPRMGRALAMLPPPPRARLLAGFWGPPRATDAADQDYDDVSDLIADWRADQSLDRAAAIARESARRCVARRGPAGDPTDRLARDLGALGWTMSHSGAARTLVLAPGPVPRHAMARLREAGYRCVHLLTTSTG